MSSRNKLVKAIQNLFRQIMQLARAITKTLMNWLLRSLMVLGRGSKLAKSGFILPTVTMVILVVILLTTAMMFRAFDRSKNASNVRVDRAVMEAATPALDRAKAKIEELFTDPTLPRQTPTESALYNALSNKLKKYTFKDEEPLKLVVDFLDSTGNYIKDSKINTGTQLEKDETLTTAWRFPVDTDNNGKYDSYTLYGLYFRSPSQNNKGQFNRPRSPLEARTPPMNNDAVGSQCAGAGDSAASLIGTSGWYKAADGQIKKSFFVYAATVPITTNTPPAGYEKYTGNKGFSALEYQQDRSRIPISNNAVVFEDDLEITPGPTFRLNGRIVTNSNLLTGESAEDITLYQVSSKDSCYYQEESSKIIVGGNVARGGILGSDQGEVAAHLFKGIGNNPTTNQAISGTNRSTTNAPTLVAYNSQAYADRIALLVEAQANKPATSDPKVSVQDKVNAVPIGDQPKERRKQLEIYFRNRTRRVPFAEVPYGTSGVGTYTTGNVLQGSDETLAPPPEWMYPTNPTDGKAGAGYAKLDLNINQLQGTEREKQQQEGKENYLGDRILAGNNLPALWLKDGKYVGEKEKQEIQGANWTSGNGTRYRTSQVRELVDLGISNRDGFWETEAARRPLTPTDNSGGLRVVTGAGVYERRNSFLPPPTYDNPNTLAIERAATYDDPATPAIEQFPIVWPDTMPMSPGRAGSQVYNNDPAAPSWVPLPADILSTTNSPPGPATATIDPNTPKYAKGDLRMRATAVYHYAQDDYDPSKPIEYQTPIACVSNYYDPTNNITARNPTGLPDVSGDAVGAQPTLAVGAKSNNGVVYGPPAVNATTLAAPAPPNAQGLFPGDANSSTLAQRVYHQANLKFPNGRFANEPLRNALLKKATGQNLKLSEQSAIDSTICAIQILNGGAQSAVIPPGAIKEVAFLDARQVKAVETDNPNTTALETFTIDGTSATTNQNLTGNYFAFPTATTSGALSIEERQPLEIRATVLDMSLLRGQTINGGTASPEYLLPNSGIIYASRDDALPDLSDKNPNYLTPSEIETRKQLSANDFKLDPTRRPNGILLSNGNPLWRTQNFREAEKGLILATDLPVYVWGNFNLHTKEEFTNPLADDWGNFYTRAKAQIDNNFACRKNDPRLPQCTTGDDWRPATVLADSVTLLSKSDNDNNPANDNPALGFRFGYRNEGDYNLINNQGDRGSIDKRLKNGFWNNNFVTNGLSSGGITIGSVIPTDASYSGNNATAPNSSYFNNFVTPIQRRVNQAPEYVMEICRKLPVSECTASDWVVGFDVNGDGNFYQDTNADEIIQPGEYDLATFDVNGDGTVNISDREIDIKANHLGRALIATGKTGTGGILTNANVGWNTAFTNTPPVPGGLARSPIQRLGAGTTATSAQLIPADQGYARRVAFARNQVDELVFTEIVSGGTTKTVAKPLGVGCPLDEAATTPVLNGCAYPITGSGAVNVNFGSPANNANALWFRTTNNTVAGDPGALGGITYANGRPLYYETDPIKYAQQKRLHLPQTSEIPGVTTSLNSGGINAPSNYAVCITGGSSQSYSVTGVAGTCTAGATITAARTQLSALTPVSGTLTGTTQALPAAPELDNVYVYKLPTSNTISGAAAATPAIITLTGNPDSIFVFQADAASSNPVTFNNVKLVLKGVDPNNIFWVSNSSVAFGDTNQLAGNFLGVPTGTIAINNTTRITGGRFLGFGSFTTAIPPNAISAMTSQDQPLLVPVVQLQQTDTTPAANLNTIGTRVQQTRWLMKANPTTFNLVAATGDTPTRANATGLAESNGGLHNFVRFLENWTDAGGSNRAAARISGSFIQLKRSNYATAPFDSVVSANPGGIFGYPQAYSTDNLPTGVTGWGKLPYYVPPERQWGFDVALLSQLPDLFSQRFTLPPTSSPDEFFRQVGRDDPWVQTLLCAAVGEVAGSGYTFKNKYALTDSNQPPESSCRPLTDY